MSGLVPAPPLPLDDRAGLRAAHLLGNGVALGPRDDLFLCENTSFNIYLFLKTKVFIFTFVFVSMVFVQTLFGTIQQSSVSLPSWSFVHCRSSWISQSAKTFKLTKAQRFAHH